MATISPDTFDPLRFFVAVRLQQGVPLVDADWNELEDIRRFELRAFLKWFVGNGIPDGNDGFRIDGTGAVGDFTISAGFVGIADGLSNIGRCIVDGLDAMIAADLDFTAQDLHIGQPGAATLSALLGVPVIEDFPPLPPAATINSLTAYLDVWDRVVMPDEDPTLVHPGLGTESCARLRREWVVRLRSDPGLPISGDADFVAGHSYLALATIEQDDTGVIDAASVTDLRRRRLRLPSQLDAEQISQDAFGPTYTMDEDGQPKLPASLREVMNAMLRSGRAAPIGPVPLVTTDGPQGFVHNTLDANGDQWLFWVRGSNDIMFQRQTNGVWGVPQLRQILPGQIAGLACTALTDGSVWLFWTTQVGPTQFDVFGQVFDGTSWLAEFTVNAGAGGVFSASVTAVTDSGNQVMVVWQEEIGGVVNIRSRRYLGSSAAAQAIVDVNSGGPPDLLGTPVLTVTQNDVFELYGTVSNTTTPSDILQITWLDPAWSAPVVIGPIDAGVVELGAAADRFGGTWLVYGNGNPSLTGRYIRSGFLPDPAVLIDVDDVPRFITLSPDAGGNLRVHFRPESLNEIHEVNLISEV